MYYTRKTLLDAEKRYCMVGKMALALVMAKKNLRHYFESYTIVVVMNYPIRQVLSKLDLSGRLTKWAIERGEFDIQFKSMTTIKGQSLANFITAFTYRP